jgi:hypothetical protein
MTRHVWTECEARRQGKPTLGLAFTMANESAKKRVAKNTAGLKWRRAVAVGALLLHCVTVYALSRTHVQRPVLLLLSTVASAAAYGCVACPHAKLYCLLTFQLTEPNLTPLL